MRTSTWNICAIATMAGAGFAAIAPAVFLASIMFDAGRPVSAIITFGLVFEALARRTVRVASWFWPERCDPAWLQRNPPLFRFDRLRG